MSPRLPTPPIDQPSLDLHVRHLRAVWLTHALHRAAESLARRWQRTLGHPGGHSGGHARTA
ncbi:hypothetical protein [Roseospirillum parvum]|uniref:Uncharacterized protein n=1 Tax=Roseospirillum parvum TaxID=83401 RepID=A0A1G8C1F0_9PROT|nr:hypothetical protein [Roseospirillum parvum]SDH39194.1 hypothetical protein SAMN05421742_106175 [Roseospirillum parvum]